jgi:hypothetical protein
MIITQNTITDQTYEQAVAARNHTARALYQAELALHDAHQTRVDQWIGRRARSPARSHHPV